MQALQKADCRNGQAAELNLAELTDFSWNKLYIMGPYHNLALLNKSAGVDLSSIRNDETRFGKGNHYTLVFVREDQIQSLVKFPKMGDFSELEDYLHGYSPAEAIFKICESEEETFMGEKIYLVFKEEQQVITDQ